MQPSPNQPQDIFPAGREPDPGNPYSSAESQAVLLSQYRTQAYNAAGSNFYTIAVFSLINSVIAFFEFGVYFPIGLGVTQVIDAISMVLRQQIPEAGAVVFIVGAVLDLAVLAVVAAFGYFAKKQVKWLIPTGGILYLLDGLLVVVFGDWIGGAFHAYFLYRIWQAWQAIQKIEKISVTPSAIETLP